MAYTSWSVAFAEQPSTAKWNILGTNAADADSRLTTVEAGYAAWTSWTPAWTNLTIGTGGSVANAGYHRQIGKTVFIRTFTRFGTSGNSMGTSPYFAPPVTPNSDYVAYGAGIGTQIIGNIEMVDTATTAFTGFIRMGAIDKIYPIICSISGSYLANGLPSATTPFTWAAGDYLHTHGTYEAA